MLNVYGHADSSNVQAVMWCIGALDIPHEPYDVGDRFGGTDTPDFIAMNPNHTVPVPVDGDGSALWESSAILRYWQTATPKHHSGLLIPQNALRSTNGQNGQR